jgi:hypothetical protein
VPAPKRPGKPEERKVKLSALEGQKNLSTNRNETSDSVEECAADRTLCKRQDDESIPNMFKNTYTIQRLTSLHWNLFTWCVSSRCLTSVVYEEGARPLHRVMRDSGQSLSRRWNHIGWSGPLRCETQKKPSNSMSKPRFCPSVHSHINPECTTIAGRASN